jgi:hypothetical protein
MHRRILATALAVALFSAAAPGLIGLNEARQANKIPLEIMFEGEKYLQTWGIIPEERIAQQARPASYGSPETGFQEIFVPLDQRSPYDEIYLRVPGGGLIVFIREKIIEGTAVPQKFSPWTPPGVEIGNNIAKSIDGDFGLATVPVNPSSYPSADNAAKRVLGYWNNNDRAIKSTKYLLYSNCKKSDVKSNLNLASLRYWYNVGHGNTDLVAFYDGNMYSNEFSGLSGLPNAGVVLNSCYTYNGALKTVITQQGPAYYMAGKIALPVGPSEEVSGDFWYYYIVVGMDEVAALNSAVSQNPGTQGWFGLWT